VRGKWVPFDSRTLLGNAAVVDVNADEAVIDTATLFPILKNKAKLLIYIFFSKSGLAGQHNYLTPIVSMSFY
jgi:hypothetical protein